jgi:hypothetical protein
VSITLALDGHDMEMRSCSRCDTRFWREAGTDVELPDVLGREPARQPSLR